jgi:hypothetical protein
VRLRVQFANAHSDRSFDPKFHIPKPSWQPDAATTAVESYLRSTEADLKSALSQNEALRPRSNLDAHQRRFLNAIKQSPDFIVKPADKNLGLTLMNRTWYDGEVLRQLADKNTYEKVARDSIPIEQIYKAITDLANQALKQKLITSQVYTYLRRKIPPAEARIPQIYILPKVHKAKLAGRPIIPGHSWITTPASILIDHLLQPLLRRVPTVIADSKSLVVELNEKSFENPDLRLITADVSSLYTEIRLDQGIAFVRQLMREHPDLIPAPLATFITALLTIVMENNYFQFNGEFYKQKKGTAMGTPAAVIFANIFMFILERKELKRYKNDIVFYKRYLDDIILFVNGNSEAIKASLQSMQANIKLEFQESDTTATFLDITFFKGPRFNARRILDTKVHQKQLNAYLYVPYASSHPDSTKRGYITAELKRYVRNTSSLEDYLETKELLWHRLRARGYPPQFLTRAFSKVRYRTRSKLLQPKQPKLVDSNVFFTTEFTPLTSRLPLKEILTRHSPLLADEHLVPGIGFKSTPNLYSMLCRNKVAPPPPAPGPENG